MALAVRTNALVDLSTALTGRLDLALEHRQSPASSTGSAATSAGESLAGQSDEALIRAVSASDHDAFNELLRRHLGPVHSYLFRLTRSRTDAEDLAQETFLRVWQKAHTFQAGRVQVATWIHRIAHNLCVDQFRKRREVTGTNMEADAEPAGDSAFDRYAATETAARLESAIARLPESQRAALLLCQVQGFSNTQAAEILDVGVRALESLLARGRRTLRAALAEGDS